MNGDKINIIRLFVSYEQELPAVTGWEQAILDVLGKSYFPVRISTSAFHPQQGT